MSFENPTRIELISDAVLNHGLARFFYRRSAEEIGLEGSERVLDFGAGSGALSRHIAQILLRGGGRVTCLDTSEAWMRVARKRLRRYGNVEFVAGDITSVGLEERSFDVVVVHFVLHEIEREKREKRVEALSRALKENGRLFIKESTREPHGISPEEVRGLMAGSGLREVSYSESKLIHLGPVYTGVFAGGAASGGE